MRRKARKSVGLLGLGIIGTRVAASLRTAGFQTYVWNRTPRPAPNFLPTPAEVASVCDIIQIFVADANALRQVVDAMAPKLTPEHLIICSGTVGPEATLAAAKMVAALGGRFLDAPFTGSKVAAERGQLVYYVGGEEAAILRAKPILEASSKAIVRIGGVGDAAIIKVVTNQIAAVSIQALTEALATVRKAGIPTESLAAALEHNGARSGTMDLKLPKMLARDYEPHFALKHMFKDVQLAIHLANQLELDIPATAVTAGVLYDSIKRGWGDLDFAALNKIYDNEPGQTEALTAGSSAGPEVPVPDGSVLDAEFTEIEPRPASEIPLPGEPWSITPHPENAATQAAVAPAEGSASDGETGRA